MFNNLGLSEILVIAAVLMLLFGGQKFPELARGIAQAMREFKKALNEDDEAEDKSTKSKKV